MNDAVKVTARRCKLPEVWMVLGKTYELVSVAFGPTAVSEGMRKAAAQYSHIKTRRGKFNSTGVYAR